MLRIGLEARLCDLRLRLLPNPIPSTPPPHLRLRLLLDRAAALLALLATLGRLAALVLLLRLRLALLLLRDGEGYG